MPYIWKQLGIDLTNNGQCCHSGSHKGIDMVLRSYCLYLLYCAFSEIKKEGIKSINWKEMKFTLTTEDVPHHKKQHLFCSKIDPGFLFGLMVYYFHHQLHC